MLSARPQGHDVDDALIVHTHFRTHPNCVPLLVAHTRRSIPLLLVILALHLAVGLVLKLYFFNY